MKSNIKFFNNDEGVSPIVATLVLIVVAIIGAAAVGLIMSSFSSNVANQANNGNTAGASSTTITIAGSTSMYPVINTLAGYYTTNNTGVKISVSSGGSGAGYVSAAKGYADIGMISEAMESVYTSKYPNLKAYQVGESGVVFAASPGYPAAGDGLKAGTPLPYADIVNAFKANAAYPLTDGSATIATVYDRSDISGTQDTAMSFLGNPTLGTIVSPQSGNDGVEGKLASDKAVVSIGILDSDYAFGSAPVAAGIKALVITDAAGATSDPGANAANVISEIKNNNGKYASGLVRPLNFITNGQPSSLVQGFINYVEQPGNTVDPKANQNAFAAAFQ